MEQARFQIEITAFCGSPCGYTQTADEAGHAVLADMHFLSAGIVTDAIIVCTSQTGKSQLQLWFHIAIGFAESFSVFSGNAEAISTVVPIQLMSHIVVYGIAVCRMTCLDSDIYILTIFEKLRAVEREGVEFRIPFAAHFILGTSLVVVESTAKVPAALEEFIRTDLRAPEAIAEGRGSFIVLDLSTEGSCPDPIVRAIVEISHTSRHIGNIASPGQHRRIHGILRTTHHHGFRAAPDDIRILVARRHAVLFIAALSRGLIEINRTILFSSARSREPLCDFYPAIQVGYAIDCIRIGELLRQSIEHILYTMIITHIDTAAIGAQGQEAIGISLLDRHISAQNIGRVCCTMAIEHQCMTAEPVYRNTAAVLVLEDHAISGVRCIQQGNIGFFFSRIVPYAAILQPHFKSAAMIGKTAGPGRAFGSNA